MIQYAQPGDTVYFNVAAATGLVGTMGVKVTNAAATSTVTARTTAGISEPDTGDYVVAVTAPDTAGSYRVVVDDGSSNTTVHELVVTYTPLEQQAGDMFASTDDFAAMLGISLTANEEDRATTLLALASGLIREAANGQTISLVTDDVYTRKGTTDQRILLPQRPVVAVSSVTLDGAALTADSDWYLDGDELVRRTATLVTPAVLEAETLSAGFGYEWQTLEITYTHGFETIPNLVRTIALEAVVRAWVNPGRLIQQTVAGTETTFAPYADPPRGLLLTKTEIRAIRRKFGSRGGSVWVGG